MTEPEDDPGPAAAGSPDDPASAGSPDDRASAGSPSDPASAGSPGDRASPTVKICGVTRAEDARAAADAGASWVGVVLVPSSPRAIDAQRARALMEGVPLPLVLVVSDLGVEEIAAAAEESGAAVLQLHGDEPPEVLEALRRKGSWELWKVVRIQTTIELRPAFRRYAGGADALLVEGWHPRLKGGAGAGFSWSEAARFRDELAEDVKFIVAGGLTPDNVAEAVRLLRPDVVDTSSGVETSPGIKDPARIRAFVHAARGRGRSA